MPSKLLNRFFVISLAFLVSTATAHAVPNVAPSSPHTVVKNGGEDAVFYASANADIKYGISKDYPIYDFSGVSSNYSFTLQFAVSGLSTANPSYLYVFGQGKDGSSQYVMALANCNDGLCTSSSGSAFPNQFVTNGVSSVQITLDVRTVCQNDNIYGCIASGPSFRPDASTSNNVGLKLRFVSSVEANPTALSPDTIKTEGRLIQVIPQVKGPRITACPLKPGYFPGDQAIIVDGSAFTATQNSTFPTSPAFTRVRVLAQSGGSLPTGGSGDYIEPEISKYVNFGAGSQEVTGFQNSTEGSVVPYNVDYGVEDSSGLISYCGNAAPSDTAVPGYPLSNVFATDIQGFLSESNCFIATASFRDARAGGVMLLREFRDQVLSETPLGRSFIEWYYRNGPVAANWLLQHPVYRSFFLSLLIPLQFFAWVTLHPGILFFPGLALLTLIAGLIFSRRKNQQSRVWLFLAVLLTAETVTSKSALAVESNQPYIDSLVSELPKEPYTPNGEGNSPYIDSVKKKMGKGDDSTGYTDQLKKELSPKDGSEGYTSRIRKTLPETSGSAIEDFRKGKKLRADKGDLNARSAVGFKLFANATRTYTAGANQELAYETVYGSSWIPDLAVHYEYRPFTGDFTRKLGLYGSIGTSFTKAQGKLQYFDSAQFESNESKTQFKFIALPVNVGLIYRMNVANILFPFIAGGPSTIGFIESRNDNQKSNRGYTFGYWFSGGVALGLDWISAKDSWEQYDATGTKHSYLTIDYTYLESFGGGLVEFTVNGIEVGFTFEI